ncbi:hypothetical protein CANARDRAFT_7570 [[Candida] arabinofermentans NRRL YB-2248]|uniref:GOLD domain-containing protein n=1 Tax=[Candida] arabinofermentans NRRL YB-2248 TaxID=983967 RepID=A0A1E4T131_9ASCO|nr:hypothetical protein CANARDRAFT_7570 [[Candida] arabinofermentans NRRL YB-2248]
MIFGVNSQLSLNVVLVALLVLVTVPAQAALHFYLEAKESQCFYKDLAKDSVLMIKYKAEAYDGSQYSESPGLSVFFTIEEKFDNYHMVASQRGMGDEFIFTSFDSGEHKICLKPEFNGYRLNMPSRITVDMDTGTSKMFDKPNVVQGDIFSRVTQLYKTLENLKQEYKLFRIKEMDFRDLSEKVNSRVITLIVIQFVVLFAIGYYQLYDLKSFFHKQKVV